MSTSTGFAPASPMAATVATAVWETVMTSSPGPIPSAGKTIQYMGVSGPLQFNKFNNVVAPYTMLITEGDHWKVFKFYSADNFKLE